MYNLLQDLENEDIKRVILYLTDDDNKEDKIKYTNYPSPFSFLRGRYKSVGYKTQLENIMTAKGPEDNKKNRLISFAGSHIRYKNGKQPHKRIKEAIEIFQYFDIEEAFEAGCE